MRQFILIIYLILVISCLITARRDRIQRILENHLAQEPNKLNLLSNNTFCRHMFQSFRNYHPRRYRAVENETARYERFQERLKDAVESDVETTRTFTVGLNKFSDWTPPELDLLRGNLPPPPAKRAKFVTMKLLSPQTTGKSGKKKDKSSSTSTLSTSFDYTTRVSAVNTSTSIIRPIRDQGACGSCYAFALVTLLEAQYAFQYGQAVNMSDQQIVDCSTGDVGCDGGYFDTSFDYIKSNNWYMNSASDYPYTGVASNCSAKTTGGWSVGNLVYRQVQSGNVTAMEQALINHGPLWISLYVGSDCSGKGKSSCPVKPKDAKIIMNTFQSYTSGIFQAEGCKTSADNNNHAMVIVGYGYDEKTKLKYWKIRNSWSDEWGEDGYVKIQRGVNMCNVESDAFFVAKPVS